MSQTIAQLIDQVHEAEPQAPRPHIGASLLGHPCERWIWLSFRWAVREKFPGRILRLFRRGHLEEVAIMADLEDIGVVFDAPAEGSQHHVDFGCHVAGSLDAIIKSGLPGHENDRMVAEFKTHSKKSFDALVKKGVYDSKPLHYTQMQVYMMGTETYKALYYAVCKDDDRIYTEVVQFDEEEARRKVRRGQSIALEPRLPPPISTDPSWYQCQFCPAKGFCHAKQPITEVNCRTCEHSQANKHSEFVCHHYCDVIPYEFQLKGCEKYIPIKLYTTIP